MTIKEFKEKITKDYISLVSSYELLSSNIDICDFKSLNITLMNMASSLNSFISYNETMSSMVVNLTESIDIDKDMNENINGFVYIAKQTNENNLYKIGMTKDLENREKTFKTGNMFVEIIASMNNTKYKEIEKMLHKKLDSYRIAGEWFLLEKDLIQSIIKEFGFSVHIGE